MGRIEILSRKHFKMLLKLIPWQRRKTLNGQSVKELPGASLGSFRVPFLLSLLSREQLAGLK